MKNSEARSSQCVQVAVIIRPLITTELGCTNCISVVHGEPLPQVRVGSQYFTFDYVYGGSTGSPFSALYEDCVSPLVDALFHGYNATVLAYGQTASGKTYTMGTNYSGEGSNVGVIPKVMEDIFQRVEVMKDSKEFVIRVSFIEVLMDIVYDLLVPNFPKGKALLKHARDSIQIRNAEGEGTTVVGVTEAVVRTKEEMAKYLSRGSHSRATESTDMNSQSSCSHAIFTITMEQKKAAHFVARETNEDIGDDNLCAKLLLVDLAGSDCAKRTGAAGMRLKEGKHINTGLLALSRVIDALGNKQGGYIPYRDSELTRLLQDSLGGNSKTVMIACVNPADTNRSETLNTLMYAKYARNIQNKAVVLQRKTKKASMSTKSSIACREKDSEIRDLKEKNLKLETEKAQKDSEIRDLKEKNLKLETEKAQKDSEIRELETEKAQKDSEIRDLKEKNLKLETEKAQKDSEIRDLKEENVKLKRVKELRHQVEPMNASKKMRMAMDGDLNNEGHNNDLCNQGYRSSSRSEEIDTSESEYLDDLDDDDWPQELPYCSSCSKRSTCKTMRCPCHAAGVSCGTLCACLSSKCANRRTVQGGSPEFQIHEFLPPD